MCDTFIDGIWVSVQYLVLSVYQPTTARDLICDVGLNVRQCVKAQKRSLYRHLEMMKFINDYLKEE